MKLFSTRQQSPLACFRQALFAGQAPDGGLYLPTEFPKFSSSWMNKFATLSYPDLAFSVLDQLVGDEFSPGGLEQVIEQAYSFQPQLSFLNDTDSVLELFHGPTLSFKDFGAQFMAKSMGWFLQDESREITILVATSGDTGSAVAHAYHNVAGIRIVLLYPSGKVSATQEMQFTTLGDNITALEVEGTFDDCQALVKAAFQDRDLKERMTLSSANSINIGRLLPQSIYYFWSAAKIISRTGQRPIICVPSGNFGNICAGLIGDRIGNYAKKFIAAVNANDVIAEYVETGEYRPRPSRSTLSNAMDVGRPSNWERIETLFDHDHKKITERMWSTSVNDKDTRAAMRHTFMDFGYVADPHTSVALEGLRRYRAKFAQQDSPALVLSTAHPAKFHEIVKESLDRAIELPPALRHRLDKQKKTHRMSTRFDDFKQFLWRL